MMSTELGLERAEIEDEETGHEAGQETWTDRVAVRAPGIRHELRTPLNQIIGYSELLIEEAREEGREAPIRDLEKIRGAGKRLLNLVNYAFGAGCAVPPRDRTD